MGNRFDAETLKKDMTKARKIIEDHSIDISKNHFEYFPKGACGDMCAILMD